MEVDDKKLIADYLEGDSEALTALIQHNLKLVYRFAFRMVGNQQDAEEITQDTLVKLWRNAKKFNPEQNFRTWLLSIAHNTAVDLLRKRKSFVFSDFDTDERMSIEETIADPAPLPVEILMRAEEKMLLDKALAQISFTHKEVLILHYQEQLTFNEIGVIMNKPLNTVKSHHRRGLVALRKILEGAI